MNQFAFMVSSAINTKFGVYDSEQRLTQTLNTIKSVRERAPNSKIYIVEMGAIPLTEAQKRTLTDNSDNLISFNNDITVKSLFYSTNNWDIVKNVTEVYCFSQALSQLRQTNLFSDIQRIFKLSGRYQLDENFNLDIYQQYKNKDLIVLGRRRKSQFSIQLTGVEMQYMSRLWSWPTSITEEIVDVYQRGLYYMQERLIDGGYCDIEHMLYKFLDHNKILELDSVGVCGNIGPNGHLVKD